MLAWAPGLLAPAGDEDFAEAPMLCHSIRSGPLALAGRLAGWQTGISGHGSRISCAMPGLAALAALAALAWACLVLAPWIVEKRAACSSGSR